MNVRTNTNRPLRIALYGSIHHSAGSMATTFFNIVREWLRAGHEVDLYSPGTYLDPADLTEWPNLRYVSVVIPRWKQPTQLAPRFGPRVARAAAMSALAETQRVVHEAEVASVVLREHARARYDAFVVINRLSHFVIPEGILPVISFVQGSPNGEKEFIRRRGDLVRAECGWSGWALLRAGYETRDLNIARTLARSSFIIVPSEWTASMFEREGWPRARMATLWPPIDLRRFAITERPASASRFTFLWLGRIVPRKRFELALEALARLRARRPSARLIVIGGAGYREWVKLRLPALGDGVERGEPMPNDRVPELMARTDTLLQPSENENFGASAAEAAACGVPSVLGPTNGTAESLGDTAFLFDRYDPDSVAGAMERAMDAVLSDRTSVASRARAIAERNLSLPSTAARAADLIRQAVEAWHSERGLH